MYADVGQLGLKDRVLFTGFRRDIPQILAALDIYVHTSLEKDSSPLALVSAMAAGRPIVCSRVDGAAELIEEDVEGLLTRPGDSAGLAEALKRLVRDLDLRKRLGQAARAKAERDLSVERFTRRCEAVFERALG